MSSLLINFTETRIYKRGIPNALINFPWTDHQVGPQQMPVYKDNEFLTAQGHNGPIKVTISKLRSLGEDPETRKIKSYHCTI